MENQHLAFQRLDIYKVALQFMQLVCSAPIKDPQLRDQATRAAKSAFLQLCEGLPNDGAGMRRKYFTESNNSVHECVGCIDGARAIGALRVQYVGPILGLGWRFKRMLRKLLPGCRAV